VVRESGLTTDELVATLGSIYRAAGHMMGTPRRPDTLEEGCGGVGNFSMTRFRPVGSRVSVSPGDQDGAVLIALSQIA